MTRVGVLGGTGPYGMGLALRLVIGGEEVIIGSRSLERAATAVRRVQEQILPRRQRGQVRGTDNVTAARDSDVVVLSVPFAALATLVGPLGAHLDGKIVIDVVNPITVEHGLFRIAPVAGGSASAWLQTQVPGARVVGSFKNISSRALWRIDRPLHGDVLTCSDDPAATRYVSTLVEHMPLLRAVDAGPLANVAHLESLTALLLNLNRRYQAQTAIQILGL